MSCAAKGSRIYKIAAVSQSIKRLSDSKIFMQVKIVVKVNVKKAKSIHKTLVITDKK